MRGAWEPRTAVSLSDERRPVLGAAVRASPALQLTAKRIFAPRPSGAREPRRAETGRFDECGPLRAESLSVRRASGARRGVAATPCLALTANARVALKIMTRLARARGI